MYKTILASCALTLLAALPSFAQSGVISGVVYGPGDTREANFIIQITSDRTGEEFETRTNDNGEFRLGGLQPGDYLLTSDVGQEEPVRFSVSSLRPVEVVVHSSAGGGLQSEVKSEVMSVALTPPQVSESYPQGVIDEAVQPDWINPNGELYGAYNLSLLVEAIRPPLEIGNIVAPSVAGRPGDANDFSLDGIDNNDRTIPGPLLYLPDDATEEFTLQQNGFDPISTHITGATFNSIIRSGANDWHGSGYWYFQNHQLNARDARLDNLDLQDRPRFSQHRVGGTLGAPIIEDRLFGTVNLEYIPLGLTRYAAGRTLFPTETGLRLLSNNPRVSRRNLNLLNPDLATTSAIDTVNVDGVSIPVGLVSQGSLDTTDTIAGSAGLDFVVDEGDRITGRYVHNDVEGTLLGAAVPGFRTLRDTQSTLATVGYTHAGAAWWANDLRLGYTRLDTGLNPDEFAFADGTDAPLISIQGVDLNLGPRYPFRDAKFNTYQLNDNLTLMMGRHDIKIGIDARRIISSQTGFPQFSGNYTYSSLERFLLDRSPDVQAQRAFGDPALNANQWLIQGWIQDRYKLASTLTLEMGLQYQWAQLPEFVRRQGLNADLDVDDIVSFNEPSEDRDGFGPRVGIAYAPFQSFVVRAGGGVQYDTLYLASRMSSLLGPQSDLVTMSDPLSTTSGFLNSGLQRPNDPRGRLGAFFPDQELPYTIHWNAGVQGSLWKGLTASVRYIGNRNVNQLRYSTANPNGFVNAERNLPVFFNAPSAAELSELDLTLTDIRNIDPSDEIAAGFTNPVFGFDPVGTSWYHAAIAEINQSLVRGFQMSARYTLSDLQIDSYGTQLDLGFDRSGHFNAPFNPDHRLTLSGVIDVADMFPGGGNVWSRIVANLSVMGAYTFTSDIGLPLSNGLDTSLTGVGAGAAIFENRDSSTSLGTGVVPLRNNAGQIVAYRASNPNARFVQGGIGSFSTGQSFIDLDQSHNFDVAAAKKFTFVEDLTFEFRAEAYNVLNTRQTTGYALHGLATPSLSLFTPSQLVPSSANFGDLNSLFSSNPRRLQLALRLTF